ncbi:response regulator [Thalassolituus sp.]|jgi:CheY-like chemotaxis protein|uniref:response regulator n=1 Tax=Thalassolituus sp. TaxID=2030822 RepID=UPI0032D939FE
MAQLNILIVDDAAFIRDLVKKAVRDTYPAAGIHEAIDGRKAISIMNGANINLVLCDWEMPEVSGIEVLQWMRADERYKSVPFMMITSRGERDHVIKAVQAGVSEYIGKPFTRDNFVAKLSKLVFKHHKIRPGGAKPQSSTNDSASLLTGGSAPVTKPAADLGGASVLMGGAAAAPKAQGGSDAASLLMGGAAPAAQEAPAKPAVKARGVASVRFGSGGQAKLVIKDINLQELIGVFRRDGSLPALLEPAVLDIVDQESGDVARINGYVRMMQAQEPHPDAETIQMIIRYVDDDEEKLATLSRFIARVR